VGWGSGDPLATSVPVSNRGGGVGCGSGEPLAVSVIPGGGVGCGSGDPLIPIATTTPGGGVGCGSGDPLAATNLQLGILRMSLTLLITGSTIKIARTSNASRTEAFFMMVEPLLGPTMRNRHHKQGMTV